MSDYPPEKVFTDSIDGVANWHWPEHDTQLFVGVASDWMYYHKHNYFKHLKKTDVCIQAGGACGMYPKLLSKQFKTVYTFEPQHENFYFLSKNCPEKNIIKFNAALGSETGFISLEKPENTNQGEFTVDDTKGGIIPVLTIDSFNFPVVDFIQLDVEGYEAEVLKGAVKTIKKHKPLISIEIPLSPPKGIFEIMHNFGYLVIAKSNSDLIFIHKVNIEE